ncbi:MAG: hypothetical protein WCX32_01510 [Clostridia bacterium]|jgi:ABC-2 type transport system permease protein|nr:hypothetical protein [Clostridia bacterium]
MKKLLQLIAIQIKNQFRLSSKIKPKYVPLVILGLVLAFAPLIGSVSVLMYFFGQSAIQIGIAPQFLTVMFLGVQFVTIFFSVPTLYSLLYSSKDSEFLSGLPIKPSQIFFSKMVITYLTEIVITLCLLPLLIAFGIGSNVSALFYIILPFVVLILPVLPLLLSAILTIPLMYIVSYFKRKAVLASIFILLITMFIFGGYLYFVYSMTSIIPDDPSQINLTGIVTTFTSIAKIIFFDYAFANVLLFNGNIFLNLLVGLGTNLVILILSLLVASKFYEKGVSAQLQHSINTNQKVQEFVSRTTLKSLIIKDFKEILKNTSLMFYCSFSIIFTPLFLIFYLGSQSIGSTVSSNINLTPLTTFAFILMLAVGMNYVATCSITRENNSIYILKIIPVSYKTILQSKLILGFCSSLISVFVSILMAVIFLNINVLLALVMFIALAILSYAFTCLALDIDIRKPRLNYTSITEGIKNSPSSLTSMFSAMGLTVVFGAIFACGYFYISNYMSMVLTNIIVWVFIYAISIILAVVFHKNLYKNAEQKIENIFI